jgi:hypothetical protein
MALSAFQVWQHRRKGKKYCQAWIMRDNTIIATVNEPFNAEMFTWEDRTYIRKTSPDLVWGDRDIFIYEYDNALGKVLTVKDALGMMKDDDNDANDTIQEQNEKDIVIGMDNSVDPIWLSGSLGHNIVNDAIGLMSDKPHPGMDIMAIIMGALVLMIVLYVFLA